MSEPVKSLSRSRGREAIRSRLRDKSSNITQRGKPSAAPKRPRTEEDFLRYRVKALPDQLERARLRYIHLCREARRLGMKDLLSPEELGF